jgi:hypothetical protein
MNWPFDKLKANGFKLLRAESITLSRNEMPQDEVRNAVFNFSTTCRASE